MPTISASPTLRIVAVLVFAFSLCFPAVLSKQDLSRASNDACTGFTRPGLCPINCFRPDPVCGEDGITYWCGCPDALCHGTGVVKLGPCEVGSGGSSPLPGQALLLVHIVWLILLGDFCCASKQLK
ncbi:uncharacterized protein LOC119984154 isoform X2 [Tripterygium wilfordii]|uniref:uncharacterized protein LOC119984154 isoform X2 n=1 Tax=Tripterygium wilfordii TaxID=458696 RepID=UPI0018F8085F|nr:uncharacterized protein LOC119984154 isoform X2 [Tripterygium wilfordii]